MRDAGKWMEETGKNPSMWWQLQNLNREFLLQHAKPEEFFVALQDDEPVASVVLQLDENPTGLHIHWVAVMRMHAGKGLVKMLVDFAEEEAKRRGINRLNLETNADEVKLRGIYEALGFKLTHVEQEDYRKTAHYTRIHSS